MAAPEQNDNAYEDLVKQNQALLQQIADLKSEQQALWAMLSGANRRLQMSSAAIKAAVSSLLNYDIFWDGANQHEFLKTIDNSVDQAGRLVKMLTLVYRLEANHLIVKREYQVLQEIVAAVHEHMTGRFPQLDFGMDLPREGEPALVSYELIMLALEYLIEAIASMGVRRIGIQAVEETGHWILNFEGLDAGQIQEILDASRLQPEIESAGSRLSPENRLRGYTALKILLLQGIRLETGVSSNQAKLCLIVPKQPDQSETG